MQRELKFRGMLKTGFFLNKKIDYLSNISDIFDIKNEFLYFELLLTDHNLKYAIEPETIGQYTGLDDKNGKKIYEGDIIKFYGRHLMVKYDENLCGYILEQDELNFIIGEYDPRGMEVIGNIYENPELLEKK